MRHVQGVAPAPMLATQQIFLIASLLCFLTFLTLLSVASEGVRGMRALLLASVLGMVGNALYAFGRELPPLLAFEGANVTYAAASAALVAGYRQLAGLAPRGRLLAALVGALGLAVALFHYRVDSFFARSALVSAFQAGVCMEIARTVLAAHDGRWQHGRDRHVCLFVLAMCTLVTVGHGARMGWLLLAGQAPASLLQPSIWSVSFLTAVSLALPALTIGGLLIAHRHIVMRAEYAANHDFLTGAASRKAFFETAAREMARAARSGQALALLLVDLDHFKSINDGWGHEAGDAALLRVAASARSAVRAVDCVARLGGDEFALLLPDTGLNGAAVLGARLQTHLRSPREDAGPPLTLSIGVTLVGIGEDIKAAMARADAALYEAKAAGRDRVVAKAIDAPLALVQRSA